MKVGMDIYHAWHSDSGIARYIRGLVSSMVATTTANHFVLFANSFRERGPSWKPDFSNVSTCAVRCPRRVLQEFWHYVNWPSIETFTGPVDIFHGTHFVLPAARQAKCVLTVHDLTYLRHPDYYTHGRLNEYGYRKELPRALDRADAVIAVSHHTSNDLVELLGYPPSQIHVVHEGVDPHFFVSSQSEDLDRVKTKYHLDQPYLVFLVGTPEPRKNLLRTVKAARLGAPDIPLVIIGQQEEIRALLGNDLNGVRLLGSIPDSDLPWVLHGAEVALYPSLYEGFGLPALEALASGVPLITSNTSSLPEVVGDAAIIVNPGSEEEIAESIRGLLSNEDLRRDLTDRGRKRASQFTWDRAAHEVLELYEQLV